MCHVSSEEGLTKAVYATTGAIQAVATRHVQILDPKRKIIMLRHPYLTRTLVVLPTRPNLRIDSKSVAREASYRSQSGESLTRWSPSLWLNTLLEKHAWLSAGLVWMQGASQSADVGVYNDLPPDGPRT